MVQSTRGEALGGHAPSRHRIAILGTRGVPASYGGFETFAEQLGSRLAARGHSVTVYGRSHVIAAGTSTYRGMEIRRLPTLRHKYFDTVVHTAFSVVDVLPRAFDIVLICNNANAPLAAVPRLGGAKVILNVDGLEWLRGKWGPAGRAYYRLCAALAPKLPVKLVADAEVIASWYETNYQQDLTVIPYGSDPEWVPPGPTISRLGLSPGRYILYVSRLEPENNAHIVIEAYRRAGGVQRLQMPLVIVGDAPYASNYKASLSAASNDVPGIMMPGAIFGDGYGELQSNAMLYVQATEVGGTHPALVEAMGRGACILANDVPEHREVLGRGGAYYARNDPRSLAEALVALALDHDRRRLLGSGAAERARTHYSWDAVTDAYERLFDELTTS